MNKLSWVAAGIAVVLAAGAWMRAAERVQADRREAVEQALRTGAAVARAYEEGLSARLDAARGAAREADLAAIAAAARPSRVSGGTILVEVVPASESRREWSDAYLYNFHTLVDYPLTVVVGTARESVMAAAERRRRDHYLTALLESVLAAMTAAALVRYAWRSVSRERQRDERAAAFGVPGLGPGPSPR